MKTTLLRLTCALALTATSLAHEGLEIGPNGGRILELSTDESLHAEVTSREGFFHIALLDKEMKPVGLKDQTLTATSGDRANPQKLSVETRDNHFVVPMQKGNEFWTIFQFRNAPGAKPITARLRYDAKPCPSCSKPEWLCACEAEKPKKK
jgi:hypothetical protein